jgi:hypothetical protein
LARVREHHRRQLRWLRRLVKFIDTLTRVNKRMQEVEFGFDDKHFVAQLVNKLGQTYDGITNIILNEVQGNKPNMAQIIAKLVDEEWRQKGNDPTGLALFAKVKE